ncbi:MAG: Fic/DOC family N-terminal domain-containing protein [Chitinivibrionales bacterium]|nr:Fic/DOC family N-terminal domain-containing protein [Chitinivibrionales bacterium]
MTFNRSKPYNDLPLLPPHADIESKVILRKVASARAALAELKGIAETIPQPEILINTILLQEAKDSSEIENIITTNDSLYKAAVLKDDRIDTATKEVIRYRQALWSGFNILKKKQFINTNVAIEIYQILKDTSAGIRKIPGTTLKNTATGEIMYTPPEGETLLRDKLDNLWHFINDGEFAATDPLIKMAAMHYQFESIHPFTDGNGRTGRILNVLYLVHEGLLNLPILYHSSYIIREKQEYYRLLKEVTNNNSWEPWIIYMLSSVEETSRQTIKKIAIIRGLMAKTFEHIKTRLPRLKQAKEITEILFMNPYCKIEHFVKQKIAVRQSASKYLKDLESIGILKSEQVWKETVYRNVNLWSALSKMSR